jgi:hypothetical protein
MWTPSVMKYQDLALLKIILHIKWEETPSVMKYQDLAVLKFILHIKWEGL